MVGSLIDNGTVTKPLSQHRLKLAEDWGESGLLILHKYEVNMNMPIHLEQDNLENRDALIEDFNKTSKVIQDNKKASLSTVEDIKRDFGRMSRGFGKIKNELEDSSRSFKRLETVCRENADILFELSSQIREMSENIRKRAQQIRKKKGVLMKPLITSDG